MADHPNLVAARAGYQAFADGDLAKVSGLLDNDIVWHVGGNNTITGDYQGKEAVLSFFGQLMQETAGTLKNDIHDMLANDEHRVALVSQIATRGGTSLETPVVQVFHIRDGKITEFWTFPEDQTVIDDFWS